VSPNFRAKKGHYLVGGTELSLLFTGCQGNMELSSQELKLLSSLDCGIAMTYVGATSFDYSKQRRLRRLKSKYLIKE
jgi:hypothetical protein